MSETTKRFSDYDQQQILQKAYNPDGSLAVGSFLAGKIGHKVEREVQSTTVDDYHFFDGATLLYTIRVTYNNTDHDEVDSAERIA